MVCVWCVCGVCVCVVCVWCACVCVVCVCVVCVHGVCAWCVRACMHVRVCVHVCVWLFQCVKLQNNVISQLTLSLVLDLESVCAECQSGGPGPNTTNQLSHIAVPPTVWTSSCSN